MSIKNNKDFKIMLHEMYNWELLELLEHPNFKSKKQTIKNQLNKRYERNTK
jgi:hypothetical protein